MIAEITAAFGAMKSMVDLGRSASGVIQQAELNSLTTDLQIRITNLAQKCNELLEENTSLKARISGLEEEKRHVADFERQAGDLDLQEVATGVFVYMNNEDKQPLESSPKYCSHCFGKRHISLLQQQDEPKRTLSLSCHECGMKILFTHYKIG